jgi:BirA family biotin operon repressor/biotin-[acetyl-CoA-carboxylase] ligase
MMPRRIHYETIDSTNTEARRLTTGRLREPLLVTAAEQFAGRGRQGRSWESPRGGAWMSLVWPIKKPPGAYAAVSLAAAVGVLRGLRDVVATGADFQIKWPNDMLLDGRKVAGILCEQRLCGGSPLEAIIVGVGVNVDFDIALLPSDLRHPATTLRAALGKSYDVETIVDAVSQRLVDALTEFEGAGLSSNLLAELRDRLAYVGTTRRWETPGGSIEGRVAGVDDAGRLLLDCPTGRVVCETGEFAAQDSERSRM